MKIGVISDTHDRMPAIREALAAFERVHAGAILHAGDIVAPFAAKLLAEAAAPGRPVHCIYGNNDGERRGLKKILPQIQDGPLRVSLPERIIVIHHALEALGPGDLAGADVVVAGHTHQVVNERRDGVLYLNPGECCGWTTGRCTVAVLDTDAVSAEIIEIHP